MDLEQRDWHRISSTAEADESAAEDSPPHKRLKRIIQPGIPLAGLSESVSPSRAAARQAASVKHAAVHSYQMPQYVDFSKWPNVNEWIQSVGWEDAKSEFSLLWEKREYSQAWEKVSADTTRFISSRLLPYVDDVLRRKDGEWILVAFAGFQVVLTMIVKEISSRFSNLSSAELNLPKTTTTKKSGPNFVIQQVNSLEEYLAVFSDSAPDTNQPSFSKTDTANRMSALTIEDPVTESPQRHSSLIDFEDSSFPTKSSSDNRSSVSLEPLFDLHELHGLPTSEFISFSKFFTQRNVIRFFAATVQDVFDNFPVSPTHAVDPLVRLYELTSSVIYASNSWERDVLEDFRMAFSTLHGILFELGLAESIVAPALQVLCCRFLEQKSTSIFDESGETLPFKTQSFSSLAGVIQMVADHDPFENGPTGRIQLVLLEWAKKDYIRRVVDSFFDLLLTWPKSRKTFVELKKLMNETSDDIVYSIISSLQSQFYSRLLRPGLNTQDILAVYTAAIRALRIIDPSRVIQDIVCEPVRKCLRSRPDTVRCIMSHITHISGGREQAGRRNSLRMLDVMIEEDEETERKSLSLLRSSDIDMDNWRTWQPDPIYAELLENRTDRKADTIELLMSIYGGQDVFINEYQLILAEKLLGYYPFDAEEETRQLRMMITRFGEGLLQKSEVMSRDAHDSQQTHNKILESLSADKNLSTLPLGIPVRTLVISHNYWPEIRADKIALPDILANPLNTYKAQFESITGKRTIEPRPELGFVKFDLQLDDGRKMTLKCNPIYAAMILPFSEKPKWDADDLAAKLGTTTALLKVKMRYWIRRNVLEESEPGVYSMTVNSQFLSEEDQRRLEDEEMESAVRYVAESTTDDQGLHMQLQNCWVKILGMVTTSQANGIALERLFTTTKMILGPKARKDLTVDAFKQFMDTKIRSREVVFTNGRYIAVKKDS